MRSFIKLALFFTLVSIALHTYLTFQHYPLKLGLSTGPSLCSLNSTFDCDAVAVSVYSSVLGIPVSIWGAVVNLMIFGTLLLSWLEWTERPERYKRLGFALALGSGAASLIMGFISFSLMSHYCLFCIALYFLSFLIIVLIYPTLKEGFLGPFLKDLPSYFQENRTLLGVLIAVPVLSFLFHRMALTHFGAGELDRIINQGVRGWISEPRQTLSVPPLLTKGPEAHEAKLIISEFADFRCGHCKTAAHSLQTFSKSYPNARFEFYVFPLDGSCNPGVQNSSGLSCFLAKAVYCAEKQNQGWAVHDLIFQYQNELNRMSDVPSLQKNVLEITEHLNYNRDSFNSCIEASETHEAILYQSQQGKSLNIQGTPTILANGKVLQLGQMIPVLEAVYKRSSQAVGN